MIRMEIRGDREVIARLSALSGGLRQILLRKITILTLRLQARVQRKLSGPVLNVVTGALRRSIQSDVKDEGAKIRGRVFSTGDVKYARIHEMGGKTKAHIIEPKNKQALMFMMGGKATFARRVNHPGSQMPERSFMRSSLNEMRDEIVREIASGIEEATRA